MLQKDLGPGVNPYEITYMLIKHVSLALARSPGVPSCYGSDTSGTTSSPSSSKSPARSRSPQRTSARTSSTSLWWCGRTTPAQTTPGTGESSPHAARRGGAAALTLSPPLTCPETITVLWGLLSCLSVFICSELMGVM